MSTEETEHLIELRSIHRRRLQALEKVQAEYGIDCPPHILLEIEDVSGFISSITKKLNASRFGLGTKQEKTKVVIIDDSRTYLEETCVSLEKRGFEVLVAETGNDGLKLIIEEIPDVILLDINLGDINGYTILLKISQMKIPTRVIMVTAFHRPGTGMAVASINSGACAYLTKDISADELVERIKQVLSLYPTIEAKLEDPNLAIGSLIVEIDHLIDELYQARLEIATLKGRSSNTPRRRHR